MTNRDLAWRAAGCALFVGASGVGLLRHAGTSGAVSTSRSLLGLLCFMLRILGIVLMIQGKRVATAWRAEVRHHRAAIAPLRLQPRRRSVRNTTS